MREDALSTAEAWEAANRSLLVPLQVTSVERDFSARMRRVELDSSVGLVTSRTRSTTLRRNRGEVTASGSGHLLLQIQRKGATGIRQGNRECVLDAGSAVLYSTDEPIELDLRGPNHAHLIHLPRALVPLSGNAERANILVPVPVGSPILQILQGLVASLIRELPTVTESPSTPMGLVLAGLVTDLARSRVTSDAERETSGLFVYARAQELILERFEDPELTATAVAKSLRVSPRYLQQVFAAHGVSPATLLRQTRLQRAQLLLRTVDFPVATIAAAVGLRDERTFRRAFRQYCGMSPAEWRSAR